MTKIIDLEIFDKAKKLMGEKFPLILEYFSEDTKKYIKNIQQGLNDKNIDIIIYSAHTVKSCAAQLGAVKFANAAKKLEFLCRNTDQNKIDYKDVEILYSHLKAEFESARKMVDQIIKL